MMSIRPQPSSDTGHPWRRIGYAVVGFAALADNPSSGTFYDPDGDGKPLASLGVYERWNNPTERKYSRNLGTGEGIELVYFRADAPSKPTAKAVHEKGTAGRTEPSSVRTLF